MFGVGVLAGVKVSSAAQVGNMAGYKKPQIKMGYSKKSVVKKGFAKQSFGYGR